jgi:hypothetical protein
MAIGGGIVLAIVSCIADVGDGGYVCSKVGCSKMSDNLIVHY